MLRNGKSQLKPRSNCASEIDRARVLIFKSLLNRLDCCASQRRAYVCYPQQPSSEPAIIGSPQARPLWNSQPLRHALALPDFFHALARAHEFGLVALDQSFRCHGA
jgi:hypothetical protein